MGLLGAKWEKGWCDVDPNELVFTFGGSYDCANFGKNRSRNATVRVRTDRYTHTHTDTQTQIGFYRAALNAGRSSQEKGVCLSVCLSVHVSNAWIVTKRRKTLSRFLYHTKDHLVF